jgi:hypothetical protein
LRFRNLAALFPACEWTCGRPEPRVASRTTRAILILAVLAFPTSIIADQRDEASRFKYVGGTESVQFNCVGTLQITEDALNYRCESAEVRVPYRDIDTMQYRADVTHRIRKMRVRWTAYPPDRSGGSKNIYFILVYRPSGVTHVLILQVPEDQMRPYLAEIDLKMGRRVEVQSHENYSP